ncbi:MAG: hypothetical protein WCN95_07490 [bacterium]
MFTKSSQLKEILAGTAVLLIVSTGAVAEIPLRTSLWSNNGSMSIKPRQDTAIARPVTMPARDSWNEVVVMTRPAPADVCRQIKDRVAYASDVRAEDEWRSGQDTYARGSGDCEDIAASVKDLCAEKGIKTEMYIIESKADRKSHVVVIGIDGADMWMSSNGSFQRIASLNDARERISREFGWWYDQVVMTKVTSQDSYRSPAVASRN